MAEKIDDRPKSNAEQHPEAWAFFVAQARNIEKETDINHLGKYRIPKPDVSGEYIYANHPGVLFQLLIKEWYKPSLNSPSIHGKIKAIVDKL